jgi:prefoldin alpha subunit
MEQQELLYKAMELRKQSEEVERNLQFVSEQIMELSNFKESLDVLGVEKEKEMLANLGRGVFVKADRKKDEKLFVDVGAGVIVRKTPEETKKVIEEQIRKFNDVRVQLSAELEGFAVQFGEMMGEVEKLRGEK